MRVWLLLFQFSLYEYSLWRNLCVCVRMISLFSSRCVVVESEIIIEAIVNLREDDCKDDDHGDEG